MSCKKDDIMNATLDIILEEGLPAVTFSKIFKRAGVGSGTVYNYFKNMEELLLGIYDMCFQDLASGVMKDYNRNGEIFEKFRHIVRGILEYSFQYPERLIFATDLYYSSSFSEENREKRHTEVLGTLFDLIEEGQKKGIIKELQPDLCMSMIIGIILLSVKGALVKKYTLSKTDISQIVESCWKAIKL